MVTQKFVTYPLKDGVNSILCLSLVALNPFNTLLIKEQQVLSPCVKPD